MAKVISRSEYTIVGVDDGKNANLHTAYANDQNGTKDFSIVNPSVNQFSVAEHTSLKPSEGVIGVDIAGWASIMVNNEQLLTLIKPNRKYRVRYKYTLLEANRDLYEAYKLQNNHGTMILYADNKKPTVMFFDSKVDTKTEIQNAKVGDSFIREATFVAPSYVLDKDVNFRILCYSARMMDKNDPTVFVKTENGRFSEIEFIDITDKDTTAQPYLPSPKDDPSRYPMKYIGTYADSKVEASTDPTKYDWMKVLGDSSYLMRAWANSEDGITDFSTKFFKGARYIGTYVTDVNVLSNDPSSYQWTPLFDNVVVGNANLFLNSGFNSLDKWRNTTDWSISTETLNNQKVATSNGSLDTSSLTQNVITEVGSPYMISGYFKGSDPTVRSYAIVQEKNSKGAVAKTYFWNFAVNETFSKQQFAIPTLLPDTLSIDVIFKGFKGSVISLSNIKFERGNIATDWNKNELDTTEEIAQTEERVKKYADAQVKVEADKITQTVTAVKETAETAVKATDTLKGTIANSEKTTREWAQTQIEQKAKEITTSVKEVKDTVDGISFGTRNLLIGTQDFSRGLVKASYATILSDKFNGNAVIKNSYNATSGNADPYNLRISSIPLSDKYTLSFYARADTNGTKMYNYFFSPNTTIKSENSQGEVSTNADGVSKFTLTNKWEKYWVTWTQTPTTEAKSVILGRKTGADGQVSPIYISSPMLVEGNKPQTWNKAPEDIDNSVTETREWAASELKLKTDSITSSVESVKNGSYILARSSSGLSLSPDPMFEQGTANFRVYNNANNGNVTMEKEIAEIVDQPTGVASRLKVTSIGSATPGFGGVYRSVKARYSAEFLIKFTAILPVDKIFDYASNALGDGSTTKWLTPNTGTGKWEEYAYYYKCGSSGNINDFGHIYVRGGATPTAENPLTWYLAKHEIIDISKTQQTQFESLKTQISQTDKDITAKVEEVKQNANGEFTKVRSEIKQSVDQVRITVGETDKKLTDKVDSLSYDNKNFLIGTADSGATNTSLTSSILYTPYLTKDSTSIGMLGIKENDSMTLAFDWEISQVDENVLKGGTYTIEAFGRNAAGNDSQYLGDISSNNVMNVNVLTGHLKATFKVTKAMLGMYAVRFKFSNSDLSFTISRMKLEKGEVETTWSVSPDDFEKELDVKADKDYLNEVTESIMTDISNKVDIEAFNQISDIATSLQNSYETFISEGGQYENDIAALEERLKGFIVDLGDKVASFEFFNEYIKLGSEGLVIGAENNPMKVILSKDTLSFQDSGKTVAYFSNQSFFINKGAIVESLQVGSHKLTNLDENNSVFQYTG